MNLIIPILILLLIVWAIYKRVDVYASFTDGAFSALPMLVKILPALASIYLMLTLCKESGLLDAFIKLLSPILERVGVDASLVPLLLLRPFSGSGALALLNDVFTSCGVDSYQGNAASNVLGSTETIFYTVALYFGSVGITKTRYAVPVAIISGILGAITAIILTPFFM